MTHSQSIKSMRPVTLCVSSPGASLAMQVHILPCSTAKGSYYIQCGARQSRISKESVLKTCRLNFRIARNYHPCQGKRKQDNIFMNTYKVKTMAWRMIRGAEVKDSKGIGFMLLLNAISKEHTIVFFRQPADGLQKTCGAVFRRQIRPYAVGHLAVSHNISW